MLKIIIASIVCRTIYLLSILGFVMWLLYFSEDYSSLWFLCMMIGYKFIPLYKIESNEVTKC